MAITAVGDTVSLATVSGSNIQPPSGEVWDVTQVGGGQGGALPANDVQVEMYDGTDAAPVSVINEAESGMRLVITNSQYARLWNANAGTRAAGYRGVKLAP